jgi:hypothetical protein
MYNQIFTEIWWEKQDKATVYQKWKPTKWLRDCVENTIRECAHLDHSYVPMQIQQSFKEQFEDLRSSIIKYKI